jgi:hypothetical protein
VSRELAIERRQLLTESGAEISEAIIGARVAAEILDGRLRAVPLDQQLDGEEGLEVGDFGALRAPHGEPFLNGAQLGKRREGLWIAYAPHAGEPLLAQFPVRLETQRVYHPKRRPVRVAFAEPLLRRAVAASSEVELDRVRELVGEEPGTVRPRHLNPRCAIEVAGAVPTPELRENPSRRSSSTGA